jgi:hypothetical protein
LWTYGINNDVISSIIEHATNAKHFGVLEQHQDEYAMEFNVLKSHKEKYPGKYQCWPFPPAWNRGMEIYHHVDVPMHLLFLGVVRTTLKRVLEWTKYKNKYNSFIRISSGLLEQVSRLHLNWCVVIPLSGAKFGGWVSENYLGMARIMRWFYSLLPAVQDDPPYVEPCRSMSTWNVTELKQWLTIRGLCDKGKKNELKDRVDAIKNSGNPVPPPLPPIGGSVTGVLDTVKALAVMIAHVMSPVVNRTEIDSARQHIKFFSLLNIIYLKFLWYREVVKILGGCLLIILCAY